MDRVVRPLILVLSTFASAMLPVLAQEPHVARYELKLSELKYDYGIATPVLRLQPGDVLETNTVDADGHALEDAGIKPPGPNPLTGPFYIEGAEPGDTLAIHFISIELARDWGASTTVPFFGALTGTHATALLHDP